MNIKRGLFRLWIVLAGLWLLVVAVFSYDGVAKPYVEPRGFYFLKDVTKVAAQAELDKRNAVSSEGWGEFEITTPTGFVYSMQGENGQDAYKRLIAGVGTANYLPKPEAITKYTEAYRQLEEGVTRGAAQLISIGGLPEVTLFLETDTPYPEKERQVDSVYAVATQLRDTVVSAKRTDAIQTAVIAGIAPPMVLLFVGWLVLWIFRGFTR